MTNLHLVLDEPSATFYPLSPVNGQVTFESVDSLKVKNISIKLIGKAEVKFFRQQQNIHENEMFANEEIIIEKDFILWSQIDNQKLSAGKHDFRFKFIIPEECPPSFMGEYGSIHYKLLACVETGGNNDMGTETLITISPMAYITTNCPVICTTAVNGVNITATIPHRIYSLNGSIPLNMEISNFSSQEIESIEAGIRWASTFTGKPISSSSSSSSSDGLAAITDAFEGEIEYIKTPFSIPVGNIATFHQNLKANAILPSITSCPIITHNYLIFVKINFIGILEKHQEILIPIVLSNIALHETIEGGESILPSESFIESGTFPETIVSQKNVQQQYLPLHEETDSVMKIDESTNTENGSGNVLFSGDVSLIEHPTEDAISAEASMAV